MPKPLFETVLEERIRSEVHASRDPYHLYNLKAFAEDVSDPADYDKLLVDRRNEIAGLIDVYVSTASGKTSNVVITGPAGIGKTALATYCGSKFDLYRNSPEMKETLGNISLNVPFTAGRMFPLFFERVKEAEMKKGKYGIVFLDEIQRILRDKEQVRNLHAVIQKYADRISFITCWRPQSMIYVREFYPNLFAMFDNWIYMGKLSDSQLKDILRRRLEYSSVQPGERKNAFQPFTEDAVEMMVKYSNGIPGTILAVAVGSLQMAAREGAEQVGFSYVDKWAKASGYDLLDEIERVLTKSPTLERVLSALLASGEHTRTAEVATMADLDRSTASQYLNDLAKRKFVWKSASPYSREVHYHVTPLVADYLEVNLMDELFSEKDKRHRYDVPAEE